MKLTSLTKASRTKVFEEMAQLFAVYDLRANLLRYPHRIISRDTFTPRELHIGMLELGGKEVILYCHPKDRAEVEALVTRLKAV